MKNNQYYNFQQQYLSIIMGNSPNKIKLKSIKSLSGQAPKQDKDQQKKQYDHKMEIIHTNSFAQIFRFKGQNSYLFKSIPLKGGKEMFIIKVSRILRSLDNVQKICPYILPVKIVFVEQKKIEPQKILSQNNVIVLVTRMKSFGIGLDQYMEQNDKISQKDATKIFKQLVYGYYELIKHNNKLLVVRPSNIRILVQNQNIHVKIADYGLRQIVNHKNLEEKNIIQQMVFNSPQVKQGMEVSQKNIVWGLGILYYLMLSNFIGKKQNNYLNFLTSSFENNFKSQVNKLQVSQRAKTLLNHIFKFTYNRKTLSEFVYKFQIQDAKNQRKKVGKISNSSSRKPSTYLPEYYQLSQLRGKGSFGKVFKCGNYAVKEIQLDFKQAEKQIEQNNQIKALSTTNNQNIIKLHEYFNQDGKLYLVMDWCQTVLRNYLQKVGKLDEKSAIMILKQILNGYRELKIKNIIHGDLKTDNILMNDNMQVKIADFGSSYIVDDYQKSSLQARCGTYTHMSPQVLQKIQHTSKREIWSLGVVFYQLIFGQVPWYGQTKKQMMHQILTKQLDFSKAKISKTTEQLIRRMLTIDQTERIAWNQLFRTFQLKYRI